MTYKLIHGCNLCVCIAHERYEDQFTLIVILYILYALDEPSLETIDTHISIARIMYNQ